MVWHVRQKLRDDANHMFFIFCTFSMVSQDVTVVGRLIWKRKNIWAQLHREKEPAKFVAPTDSTTTMFVRADVGHQTTSRCCKRQEKTRNVVVDGHVGRMCTVRSCRTSTRTRPIVRPNARPPTPSHSTRRHAAHHRHTPRTHTHALSRVRASRLASVDDYLTRRGP